jgi:MscS family membrane protein
MRLIDSIALKTLRALLLLLPLSLLLAPSLSAQLPTAAAPVAPSAPTVPPAQNDVSDDPLGRATPHGAVLGFVKAANRGDYEEAAQFLDTKQKGELGQKLAEQLQEVLNRETSIDLTKITRKPEGSQAFSQNPNREQIGVAVGTSDKLPIYLDRVKRGDDPPIWLFSEETLRQIPEAYENMGESSPVVQSLPGWLQTEFLSTPVWRWLLLVLALPVTLLLGSWVNRLVQPVMRKIAWRVAGPAAVEHVSSIRAPLRLLFFGIALLAFGATSDSLLGRAFWNNVGSIVTVIAVTWLASRTVGLISELSVGRLKRVQSSDKIALAGLIGRLSQIGAVIIGALVVLHLRGINLTAILTGLGIGGLAVAFAAQKTLENLFGGIMIISDRPLRIGDQCKIGSVEGYVLDIGLRSTRIRTFNRTIVTIPNGQLATMNVENYSFRDKYWFHHIVTLKYDSTAEQIERVLDGIRALLEADENVETETARARFIAIGSVSDDIEISAYVLAQSNAAFLEVQESLLLRILAIVESAGAEFSLPTQVTKVEASAATGAANPPPKS